uniref:Uncharacterized protein n=1 Tax=Mesocestoides corti TaxID=53468 RepID=A0A5K3F5F2_MESCO
MRGRRTDETTRRHAMGRCDARNRSLRAPHTSSSNPHPLAVPPLSVPGKMQMARMVAQTTTSKSMVLDAGIPRECGANNRCC